MSRKVLKYESSRYIPLRISAKRNVSDHQRAERSREQQQQQDDDDEEEEEKTWVHPTSLASLPV